MPSSLATCTACSRGIMSLREQCVICRRHKTCCAGHRCENCAISFNETSNVYHTSCTLCSDCCRCYAGRPCQNCGQEVNRTCSVCLNCSVHCGCTERTHVNSLRRTSSAARYEESRRAILASRRATSRHRDQVVGGEGVAFIAAGLGTPKSILMPVGIGTDALQHIYGQDFVAGKENGVSVIKGLPNQFKENTSRRFLCPEIEVSSGNANHADSAARLWGGRQVHDGSLPSTGFEINLSPCQGDLYERMVQEICAQLKKDKSTVTKACGLHVHADARDLDYMDIRKLVYLYELIEPALYACLPEDRHKGRYAVPCGFLYASHLRAGETLGLDKVIEDKKSKKKLDMKTAVVEMVYGKGATVPTATSKYGAGAAHDVRYRGMNLYSYYFRRSVEFRQSPGSIDPEYIMAWSLMCAGILDTAKKFSEKQIKALWPVANKELESSKAGLYHGVFNGILPLNYLKDSTKLLIDCCQPRCKEWITELQKQNKVVVTNMRTGIVS